MSMNKDHPVHLPDRLFVNHCYERFGVNRGVYNTVDKYLFTAGMIDITQRRAAMLEFLSYLHHVNGIKSNGRINFGGHGLSTRLKEYWVKTTPIPQ
ncbi:hypothetical protein SAMN05192534_13013 [Alteribacillus persepolensis]|uniref:Uncharacterized protein n=1 Tax=Alteribacillus persepolensis TaxID=568899 RepID=A0A1G8J7X7_9BACI|nr:hypothetical protein [Alteribacillus persepolensis]SDI27345.1 hypothetical protein SAMN05192534_13013 [Alteribacillus persepolensis]